MKKTMTLPPGFVWGSATAAYQVEGAWNEGGRGESIWDRFCHTPGKIKNNDSGDIACDHYRLFESDIALMQSLNLKAYRFSISWSRVQPLGYGEYNEAGLAFYDKLIDCLLASGIEPFITLYHWDLPQALEDKGGWLNREVCQHFADYAASMVARYGDRVKFWSTLNEPWCTSFFGYKMGVFAPGIIDVAKGDQVAHNLLLGHGLAVAAMRSVARQPLQIGIVLNIAPSEPFRPDNAEDIALASKTWREDRGAWLDPIFKGTYPDEQIAKIGDFRPSDLALISQKIDYLGINFYKRNLVSTLPNPHVEGAHYTAMDWEVNAVSLRYLLNLIAAGYDNPPVYITENGAAYDDQPDATGYVSDANRRDYLWLHVQQCAYAIEDGVDLRGYFAWSFMDNFEWAEGYSKRFGLVHVDFETQKRTVKMSGKWFAELAAGNIVEVW